MKRKTPEVSPRLTAVDSERAVLGTLLLGPDERAWRVAEDVADVQFSLERHRVVFGRMMAHLARARRDKQWPPCDLATLAAEFHGEGTLEQVGGLAYLTSLLDAGKSEGSLLQQHVAAIVQAAERRRAVQACQAVIGELTDPSDDDHGATMARANATLRAATETGGRDEIQWLDTLVQPAWEAIADPKSEAAHFRTGLASVDKRIRPMRGDLTVLGARPSMGKTAALLAFARGLAGNGHRVVLDVREMDPPQMVDRLLTLESGAPVRDLKDDASAHAMGADVWDRRIREVTQAAERLWELPIGFAWMAGAPVEKVAAMARRVKARHGLDALMIDYLQLLPPSKGLSGEEQWAHITRSLKQLAMELRIWIVLAAQLSRKVEERTNKRPQMSDLKGSGSIEADADHICLLYRPVYYRAKEEGKAESDYPEDMWRGAEWGWVKVRGASPGTDHMLWFGEQQRFVCAQLTKRHDDEY